MPPKPTRPLPVVNVARRPAARRLERLPEGAYQADRGHVVTIRWLAAILGLLVLVGAIPALGHLNPVAAPGWARLILLVGLLQLSYLAWMALLPDWSTVWVAMLVFASVATLCALALAVAMATPADHALPLGLEAVRGKMVRWCTAALLLNVLGTYLCGLTSVRWQRACRRAA